MRSSGASKCLATITQCRRVGKEEEEEGIRRKGQEGTVDAPASELKLLLGREMHALPSNLIAMKFVGHKIGRGRNRRE